MLNLNKQWHCNSFCLCYDSLHSSFYFPHSQRNWCYWKLLVPGGCFSSGPPTFQMCNYVLTWSQFVCWVQCSHSLEHRKWMMDRQDYSCAKEVHSHVLAQPYRHYTTSHAKCPLLHSCKLEWDTFLLCIVWLYVFFSIFENCKNCL